MFAPIPVTGQVGGVSAPDAARLSVVALRANIVLAIAPLRADGTYRLTLPRAAHHPDSPYALQVAVLPSSAAARPDSIANAPRATLRRNALRGVIAAKAPNLTVDKGVIAAWRESWHDAKTARQAGSTAELTVYRMGIGQVPMTGRLLKTYGHYA